MLSELILHDCLINPDRHPDFPPPPLADGGGVVRKYVTLDSVPRRLPVLEKGTIGGS